MAKPFIYFFDWINKVFDVNTWAGLAKRALVQLVAFPALIIPPAFGLDYLIRHKKLDGIYEKGIKPYAWPFMRDNSVFFGLPNMLAAAYLPAWSHFYVSTGLGTVRKTTISQRHIKGLDPYKREHEAYQAKNGNDYVPSPAY